MTDSPLAKLDHPIAGAPRQSIRNPCTLAAAALLTFCCGCPQYRDPTAPAPIRDLRTPDDGRDYLLYVPSTYNANEAWALVVVCHGTPIWDTPRRQIKDWIKLAEEKKFIVAAPALRGTRGDFPPPAARQIELQRQDEEIILGVVRHVRGAYNVSPDRIFLAGWSAGSYAVLWTGLRHSDLFRGLAVIQGNFNSAYLAGVDRSLDPHQPVHVLYGSTDVLVADQVRECIAWLRAHHADMREEEIAGFHGGHPAAAYDFFERVVRTSPWLHIRTFTAPGGDELTVSFKIRSSFEPATYAWDFGDGETARVATPTHTYRKAGTYQVALTVTNDAGKKVARRVELTVPD